MICNLIKPLRPSFKCGVESALIVGGGSLLGGIGSALFSDHNTHYQMRNQRAENQQNRDWQTAEAEKARSWATSERIAGQDFQVEQRDYQNMYNSPVMMTQRLQAAGLNPVIGMHGQTSSTAGGSLPVSNSAPSASMPSPVGGLSPVSYQPPQFNIGSIASGLGSALTGIANAKKAGVEMDEIRAMASKLNAESDLTQLMAVGQKLANALSKVKLPYELRQAILGVEKSMAEIDLTNQQKITAETQANVNDSLERLNDAMSKNYDLISRKLGVEITFLPKFIKAQINEMSANAQKNVSDARLNDFIREFKESTREIDISKLSTELDTLNKENLITGSQVSVAESAAEQARVAASHAEALFWKDFITDIVSKGVGAFSSYRFSAAYKGMSRAQQKLTDAKIKQMQSNP